MNISKTTFNFAKRSGLYVTIEEISDAMLLCVWDINNDCEWMFSYRINSDCLTWNGNIYLPQELKEELPATLKDEKHVREMLDYVGANRHLWKD